MSERKLASIQRISSITPHPNADNLELAAVLGWQVVVRKGEFAEGDLCVFCEVDSVLPERPEFEFLRSSKFRVRTIKLRGELSQGIMFPLSTLGPVEKCRHKWYWVIDDEVSHLINEGDDVTELLGVTKYEPLQFGKYKQSNLPPSWGEPFPFFVPKTDEIRIQSAPELIELLKGKAYVATVKLDGMSATYCADLETTKPLVCTRNRTLSTPDDGVHWQIANKYDICRRVQEWPNYAIQGEICGPKIQGNKLNLSEPDFFLFTIYNMTFERYEPQDQVEYVARLWGLKTVPVFETGGWFNYTKDECLALAEGRYQGTDNEREGLVWRPAVEEVVFTHNHKGRLSFKTISSKFLLKEK